MPNISQVLAHCWNVGGFYTQAHNWMALHQMMLYVQSKAIHISHSRLICLTASDMTRHHCILQYIDNRNRCWCSILQIQIGIYKRGSQVVQGHCYGALEIVSLLYYYTYYYTYYYYYIFSGPNVTTNSNSLIITGTVITHYNVTTNTEAWWHAQTQIKFLQQHANYKRL